MVRPRFPALRRAARLAAVGVALAAAAAAASCRDVVTDDVIDAEAALCDTFEACSIEGAACARVRDFFTDESDEAHDEYLRYYKEAGCGEGCGTVDACLDHSPLCAPTGAACGGADFECCNASTGAAACEGDVCCFGLGVVCEDADDCCPLADGQSVGCFARTRESPKTCGGAAQCALRDEPCDDVTKCCGKAVCVDAVCVVDTCVDRDERCVGDEDCCIDGDVCSAGKCGPADPCADPNAPGCCTPENVPCVKGGTPCCGGAICADTLTGETLCGGADCGPLGSDCASDEDCCDNGSDDVRCLGVGSDATQRICQAIDCQILPGAPCSDDLPCCSGLSCLPAEDGSTTCQAACEAKACHDVRSFGPAFDLDGCDVLPEPLPDGQLECARSVCAQDGFCCCVLWDESCVDAVFQLCPDVVGGAGTGSSGSGG